MQEGKIASTWCRKVTNAARFTVCGPNHEWIAYQPCCFVYTPDNTIASKQDIVKVYKDIGHYVHSDPKKVCAICIDYEKNQTKRSPREMAHEIIPADEPAGRFVQLEFVFDIRCNAACVMCGPHLSTLWQQELKLPVTMTEKSSKMHWENIRQWIDWEPARRVYFSGGEPLLTNSSDFVLTSIPDLSLVEIKYQTNGSVMPSESTLEYWKKAKKIILDISLDGTHDQYDYVRWPLQWHRVEHNIHTLAGWLQAHAKDWEVNVNYTVNPMNLLYLENMDAWFSDMKKRYQGFNNLDYGPCFHNIWGIKATTPEMVEKFFLTHGRDHPASGLLQSWRTDRPSLQRLHDDLINLDAQRNLHWQTAFDRATMLFD